MTPPVLFLVFNRPELTRRTFERIRAARPPRLYIHADGPRSDRAGEAERCAATRAAADAVDWPCEVHRLFRTENLGCGPAVAGALDWFFSHEEEGIVLEDDCLPRPGFFPWCATRLAAHRDDPSVFHVSGMGFELSSLPPGAAAFRSPLPFIWGWASWRRAWTHYRRELPPAAECEPVLRALFEDRRARDFWRDKLDRTRAGEIRTWDYQWCWTLWRHRASAIAPARSLVENLGAGPDSTHTTIGAIGYAPPADEAPVGATAAPPAPAAMREIHRAIFEPSAPPRRLDDFLRRSPLAWKLYLGLRRRFLAPGRQVRQ